MSSYARKLEEAFKSVERDLKDSDEELHSELDSPQDITQVAATVEQETSRTRDEASMPSSEKQSPMTSNKDNVPLSKRESPRLKLKRILEEERQKTVEKKKTTPSTEAHPPSVPVTASSTRTTKKSKAKTKGNQRKGMEDPGDLGGKTLH